MKNKSVFITSLISVLALSTTFWSCDRYHFSSPQPVDAANIYQFPKSFRGNWAMDRDSITITERRVKFVSLKARRIVNGIWSNPFDAHHLHQFDSARNRNDGYLKAVQYDSLRRPHDTVANYVIHGKKIYNREHLGSPFSIKGDSIYFTERHVIELELGLAGFLRRIGTDQYILNASEAVLWGQIDNDGSWWQLVLLEQTSDKKIFIRFIDHDVTDDSSPIHKALSSAQVSGEKGEYYFDGRFTTPELRKLIDLGLFEKRGSPLGASGN